MATHFCKPIKVNENPCANSKWDNERSGLSVTLQVTFRQKDQERSIQFEGSKCSEGSWRVTKGMGQASIHRKKKQESSVWRLAYWISWHSACNQLPWNTMHGKAFFIFNCFLVMLYSSTESVTRGQLRFQSSDDVQKRTQGRMAWLAMEVCFWSFVGGLYHLVIENWQNRLPMGLWLRSCFGGENFKVIWSARVSLKRRRCQAVCLSSAGIDLGMFLEDGIPLHICTHCGNEQITTRRHSHWTTL